MRSPLHTPLRSGRAAAGRLGRQAGFTLIELALALAILGVVLAAGVAAQVGHGRLVAASQDTELATEVLRATLERALAAPLGDLVGTAGDFVPGREVPIHWDRARLGDATLWYEPRGIAPGDPAPDLLEFSLTLRWRDVHGAPREERVVCARR